MNRLRSVIVSVPALALTLAKRNAGLLSYLVGLSAGFVLLLLVYTHGALLYGGDVPGYYTLSDFLASPSTDSLVFSGSVVISFGNEYAAFYLGEFIGGLLCVSGMYCLGASLVPPRATQRVSVVGAVAAFLFLFNPTVLVSTFQSFTSNVYPSHGFFIIFLAGSVLLAQRIYNRLPLSHFSFAGLGLALGLSLTYPPNDLRILLVGLLLLFLLLGLALILSKHELRIRTVVHGLTAIATAGLIATLVGGYYLIPIFLRFRSFYALNAGAAAATGSFAISGPFNTIIQTMIGLNSWGFLGGYAPYASSLLSSPLAVFGLLMWPILAGPASTLLSHKRGESRIVLSLVLAWLVIVFWEKAWNAPLGGVYLAVTGVTPGGYFLLPTFFMTKLVQSALLPLLAGYSIVVAVPKLRELFRPNPGNHNIPSRRMGLRARRLAPLVLTAACVVLLLVPLYPAFDGDLEGQWFDESIKGFEIPADYKHVAKVISGDSGSTLILPGLGTYIQTSWGYQGSAAFYNQFFAPEKVIDQLAFGGYSQFNASLSGQYSQVISPGNPGTNATQIQSSFSEPNVYGANLSRSNGSVILSPASVPTTIQATYPLNPNVIQSVDGSPCMQTVQTCTAINASIQNVTGYPQPPVRTPGGLTLNFSVPENVTQVGMSFAHPISINTSRIIIQLEANQTGFIASMIQTNRFWLGVASPGELGWYVLGSSNRSVVEEGATGSLYLVLTTGLPDTPWQSSMYDPSSVTGLILEFLDTSETGPFSMSLPVLELYSGPPVSAAPINLSGSTYVQVNLQVSDIPIVNDIVSAQSLWVGLESEGQVGWYVIGSSLGSSIAYGSNGTVLIDLMTGFPDTPWPSSAYNPEAVTGVVIEVRDSTLARSLTLSLPTLSEISRLSPKSSWTALATSLRISYVLQDYTVDSGTLTSMGYAAASIALLVSEDLAHLVYSGNDLMLYRLSL